MPTRRKISERPLASSELMESFNSDVSLTCARLSRSADHDVVDGADPTDRFESINGFNEFDSFKGFDEFDSVKGFDELEPFKGFNEFDSFKGFNEFDSFNEFDPFRGFNESFK